MSFQCYADQALFSTETQVQVFLQYGAPPLFGKIDMTDYPNGFIFGGVGKLHRPVSWGGSMGSFFLPFIDTQSL